MVIFLSNFLALLIKVDAAGEGNRTALGGILVAVNIFLILAVLSTSWFATQQSVEEAREDESSLALAKTMLTFDQRRAAAAAGASAAGSADRAYTSGGKKLTAPTSSGSSAIGPRPSRPPPGDAAANGAAAGVARGGNVSAAAVEALWKEGQSATGTSSR